MTRALLKRTVETLKEHQANWSEATRQLVLSIEAELARPEAQVHPAVAADLTVYNRVMEKRKEAKQESKPSRCPCYETCMSCHDREQQERKPSQVEGATFDDNSGGFQVFDSFADVASMVQQQERKPEQASEPQSCRTDDGMPTERAVLEREWRAQKEALKAQQERKPCSLCEDDGAVLDDDNGFFVVCPECEGEAAQQELKPLPFTLEDLERMLVGGSIVNYNAIYDADAYDEGFLRGRVAALYRRMKEAP